MLPLVRDEIRALVEDFVAILEFAAEERSVLPGLGAVGFDAFALVVVEGLRESLRNLVAMGQRDYPNIFRPARNRILRIESIIKVLRILYENAQIEGIETREDILVPSLLLVLGTFPVCEGPPPKAEGGPLWRHGIRLDDLFEWFCLARLRCCRGNLRSSGDWQILVQQAVCHG